MTPVPLVKMGVRAVLAPAVIVAALTVKLVIAGAGYTVTVADAATAAPCIGVSVIV
jgi:hypothetical protein